MPIRPPLLDDRRFDDFVEELLRRIPAHTPEWTNPRLGDPGRTLIELFAWLADNVLYRANRVPERQRLAFLQLLGQQLRPATSAAGLVSVHVDEASTRAVHLRPEAILDGPVPFETDDPLSVMPVQALCFHRRAPIGAERDALQPMIDELAELYGVSPDEARPYVTTPLFVDGPDANGWTPSDAVDGSLWLALVAGAPENVAAARRALGGADGVEPVLNVGVVPAIEPTDPLDPRLRPERSRAADSAAAEWAVSTGGAPGEPAFLTVEPFRNKDRDEAGRRDQDSTAGFTRTGIVRLAMPRGDLLGAPANEVTEDDVFAGTGDRPPRLDDPKLAARVVTWLRLTPSGTTSVALSWVGINATAIGQRRTVRHTVVGSSDGAADQTFALPSTSVDAASLVVAVAAPGEEYTTWAQVADVGASGRDAAEFEVDAEAGTLRFGDGVSGRVPPVGARVRVERARFVDGAAGNLAAGSLTGITAVDLDGARVQATLKVEQPLPTTGGADAEALDRAERRIPATLRHRERAVTAEDYRELASSTPSVDVARVEVLPLFKPQQRLGGVPGVVSVMVVPAADERTAPNPRPDRAFLERVHARLEPRRPLATELYTIGCDYVSLGLGVGIEVRDGHDPRQVAHDVKAALHDALWPLAPGGAQGDGWPLGRAVDARELEVVVARTIGVAVVRGVSMFEVVTRDGDEPARAEWSRLPEVGVRGGGATLELRAWQLPELLGVAVVIDGEPPDDLPGVPGVPGAAAEGPPTFAIPVVPEVC